MDYVFDVRKITAKEGKPFVKEHHYSHGIHNGPMCYGLFHNNDLVGVCAFATPCSENVRRSVFGEGNENRVTELHRLVLLDWCPKNSESWFVSRCLKMLKEDKPLIDAVISFADSTEGHRGTVYKALNGIYQGIGATSWFYIDMEGRLRHPRQNGKNIKKEEAEERGWKRVKREGKHRFLFLLGSGLRKKKLLKEVMKNS